MTNAAHTPGPWEVTEVRRWLVGYEVGYTDKDGTYWTIATLEPGRASVKHDANLLAAAPELLAIAQLALDHLDGQEYLQALAIIAKATGS